MTVTYPELQPSLQNDMVSIQPLLQDDFDLLYKMASDPLIWEQHPNPDRYKREVFEVYFKGAIDSGSAFLVRNTKTAEAIGTSRYYDFAEDKKSIAIGYTFLKRDHWGTIYNRALKTLMLNHAFKFADTVQLHIGANNVRSQKAIEKLGAKKTGELEMAYYGEQTKLNFIYQIRKDEWEQIISSSSSVAHL